MKQNILPKATLILWQIRIAITGSLFLAVIAFFCIAFIWLLIPLILLFIIILLLLFWYLPRYFNSYKILFPKGAIIINRGVFIKTSHIMPFSRLVYAQSFSTPLAKKFGLAAISLKAARTSIIIPEIYKADVNIFIDSLTREDDG